MKLFLTISAILAWLFGAALLIAPSGFYAPLHMTLSPMIATIAQAHGATLVGLGVVNWFARKAEKQGVIAVLLGNLVVQVLSFAVVLQTMSLGAGTSAAPALVIHAILGFFNAFFYWRARKMA